MICVRGKCVLCVKCQNSLGFTEYANFLTKFEKRTAKMMTGNPTNCTGNSKIGSCATTAPPVWSMDISMSSVSTVNDGNIIEIFMVPGLAGMIN